MDLNPVAIELYLMEPPLPTRYTINGGRQRGLNKARVGRFRAESAQVVRHWQWTPAELTGNFGGALEDIPIGDCRFVS